MSFIQSMKPTLTTVSQSVSRTDGRMDGWTAKSGTLLADDSVDLRREASVWTLEQTYPRRFARDLKITRTDTSELILSQQSVRTRARASIEPV